jgi:hypothetical protein
MRRRPGFEDRPTQTARIVALLRGRSPNWVPLPEILNLRISQYNARLYQARHQWGLNIESRVEIVGGEKHSWFRLVEVQEATHGAAQISLPLIGPAAATPSFPTFGNLAPESYGVD